MNEATARPSPVRFLQLKKAAALVLTHPVTGRAVAWLTRNRVPCRGCVIDTSAPVVSDSTKAALLFRMYESAEQRFVSRDLRTDLDVVELGGSLGVVSSQILRRLSPGRRLVIVEANVALLETIRTNVRLNAPKGDATVVHGAAHYGPERHVSFATSTSSLESRVVDPGQRTSSSLVLAVTLSELLEAHRIDRFVLVCDIEGSEVGLILHDGRALARCEQIVCEVHETDYEGKHYRSDDVVGLVQGLGFRLRARYGDVCRFER